MKKKRLWALALGIIVTVSLVFVIFSDGGSEVTVTEVRKGDIKEYVEEIGTVRCKEQRTISLEGSGLIEAVHAEVGQKAAKGELLLSMEKKQLEIQLKNIDEKINEIKAAFEGSEVKHYASNLEKAEIAFEQAEDSYALALDDYNKAKMLAEAGAVSNEELKLKDAAMKSAKALMDTSELNLQQIEANTPESVKAVYRAQLEQVMLSREAILHSMEKQEVRSPIDGVVLERRVEAGIVGAPGVVAFVIGDTEKLEIEAFILADDVAGIKPEDSVEIVERSESKQIIEGKVVKIAPGAVSVTSSLGVNQKRVSVTIEPLRQSELLKPGYEADVRVITERKNDILVVPLSSVFEYEGKACVFAVIEGKAILKPVKTGIQDESSIEIVDGLKEGEILLTEPDINIKEGMRIKPVKQG